MKGALDGAVWSHEDSAGYAVGNTECPSPYSPDSSTVTAEAGPASLGLGVLIPKIRAVHVTFFLKKGVGPGGENCVDIAEVSYTQKVVGHLWNCVCAPS